MQLYCFNGFDLKIPFIDTFQKEKSRYFFFLFWLLVKQKILPASIISLDIMYKTNQEDTESCRKIDRKTRDPWTQNQHGF